MPVQGSGFDSKRNALVWTDAVTIVRNATAQKVLEAEVSGLHRVKVVAERATGSNVATALTFYLRGQFGPDNWRVITPPTTIAAAAVGQVVALEITGNAYSVIEVRMSSDNAGATDNLFQFTLQATRY